MVEQDHPVVERERQIGKAAIIGRHVRQILGVADGVVGGKADRPAHEPRQALERDRAITLDQLLRGRETDRPT